MLALLMHSRLHFFCRERGSAYLGLWGMCSPLSMLHTRSNESDSKGVSRASATCVRDRDKLVLANHAPHPYTTTAADSS